MRPVHWCFCIILVKLSLDIVVLILMTCGGRVTSSVLTENRERSCEYGTVM
jgi:hypothetical protein